jgi:hypothetical protein
MVRKSLIFIIILSVIFSSISCQTNTTATGISGTYTCIKESQNAGLFGGTDYNKGDMIDINKDGTLYYGTNGPGMGGKWRLDGNNIYLIFDFFGLTWKGKVNGNTITLEDGSVWTKGDVSTVISNAPDLALSLDEVSMPALTVGVETTIKGTIKQNGMPAANQTFGLHDGIRQQSHLVTTDSQGRFSFSSTPVEAKPAIVEYLSGDEVVFANSVYQVKDKTGNPRAWMASEIKFENTTDKPVKIQAESPFGDLLLYTVQPGQVQTVIKTSTPAVDTHLPYTFTFKPTVYTGGFTPIDLGFGDIAASVTLNSEGVTTVKFKGGIGPIARFSVYSTSELKKGVCWEPGKSIGEVSGAEISGSICMGTDGFSIGGNLGYGNITNGFKIQIIEWGGSSSTSNSW